MGWNPLGNQEKTNFLDKMSLSADNGRSAAIRPFHPSRRLFHNFQFGKCLLFAQIKFEISGYQIYMYIFSELSTDENI